MVLQIPFKEKLWKYGTIIFKMCSKEPRSKKGELWPEVKSLFLCIPVVNNFWYVINSFVPTLPHFRLYSRTIKTEFPEVVPRIKESLTFFLLSGDYGAILKGSLGKLMGITYKNKITQLLSVVFPFV